MSLIAKIANRVIKRRYAINIDGLEGIQSLESPLIYISNWPTILTPFLLWKILDEQNIKAVPALDEYLLEPFAKLADKKVKTIVILDLFTRGPKVSEQQKLGVSEAVLTLKNGGNIIVGASGRLTNKSGLIDWRGETIIKSLLEAVPSARVVLANFKGLKGSSLGLNYLNKLPALNNIFAKGLLAYLFSFGFLRQRKVELNFKIIEKMPKENYQLANFLNQYYRNIYEPDFKIPLIWGKTKRRPLSKNWLGSGITDNISLEIKDRISRKFQNILKQSELFTDDFWGKNLYLDLALSDHEVLSFLATIKNLGGKNIQPIEWQTPADLLLAATSDPIYAQVDGFLNPPNSWFLSGEQALNAGPLQISPHLSNLAEAFLAQAKIAPKRNIVGDLSAGFYSYRHLISFIFSLLAKFKKIEDDYVGLMIAPSVSMFKSYLTLIFAGKIPVMFNWTAGLFGLKAGIKTSGVKTIISTKSMVKRLKSAGFNIAEADVNWIFLEDLEADLSSFKKYYYKVKSFISWRVLKKAKINKIAALLFTSGSEATPKGVPLSHENLLSNVKDISFGLNFNSDDRALGILPSFHSFGLCVNVVMPTLIGLPIIYHHTPMEAAKIVEIIDKYKITFLASTPTFLENYLRRTFKPAKWKTMRIVLLGAEQVPRSVYKSFSKISRGVKVMEGYGVSECSPVISFNKEERITPGSIGQVLTSMHYAVVNEDITKRVPKGSRGLLIIRGPNVFSGYHQNNDIDTDNVNTPFCEFEGHCWYSTGDLVVEGDAGVLFFSGRLKRFVKVGGEMISLPAIEATLLAAFSHLTAPNKFIGPSLAIAATSDQDGQVPVVVLLSPLEDINREIVNNTLKQAGFSSLHYVKRILKVECIPLLGSGKIDYQALNNLVIELF